ncbi:unnamed protein product [Brachionus calyciflorus]|uniref:BAR domain-containing protein n=1 Tax=Brachionus calyciflorus TaxID=104777 RepID=A0A814IWX7_9BILA|nr:unnamed protein product [Brachionus calyciflorus]
MNTRPMSLFTSTSNNLGILPRSLNNEFDKEEKKIQNFETSNKKFYKDIKSYCEKLDELVKAEAKIINNISNLSSDLTDSNQELVEKIQKLKENFSEHTNSVDQLKQTCQSQVYEPLKNFCTIFPQVYQSIKRRDQYLKEYIKQQEKLDKLQDKDHTGPNLFKLNEQAKLVEQTKQQFLKEHNSLMKELPNLYSSRIDYVKPCVNSLIKSQANFYDEYAKFYETILPSSQLSYVNSLDTDIANLSEDIQKCLSDVKSLSIVASD